MNKPVYNFKEQLKKGEEQEDKFRRIWNKTYPDNKLQKTTGRKCDFIAADGTRVELKSDFYDDPKNFFIERWSVIQQGKPGGPYQSLGKADLFVYMFVATKEIYIFNDLELLIEFVESLHLPLALVRNQRYSGGGYKVPISTLSLIATKLEV